MVGFLVLLFDCYVIIYCWKIVVCVRCFRIWKWCCVRIDLCWKWFVLFNLIVICLSIWLVKLLIMWWWIICVMLMSVGFILIRCWCFDVNCIYCVNNWWWSSISMLIWFVSWVNIMVLKVFLRWIIRWWVIIWIWCKLCCVSRKKLNVMKWILKSCRFDLKSKMKWWWKLLKCRMKMKCVLKLLSWKLMNLKVSLWIISRCWMYSKCVWFSIIRWY